MKKFLLLSLLASGFAVKAQAVNDDCAGAIVLPVGTDITCTAIPASFTDATVAAGTNSCGTFQQDIWFQFTAADTRHRINMPQAASGLSLALYSGECGALVAEQCGTGSTTFYDLIIGQVYKLQVFNNITTDITFSLCVNVPPPVIAINSDYTPEQLVNDVLINSPCLAVSNVTSSSAIDVADFNSIGYYDQNGSTFTSGSGIILSTGNINSVAGPTAGPTSGAHPDWVGDADLQALMSASGNTGSYSNASSIEFEFVPMIDHISFDFIFASHEYGTFQCNFSDAFAFILTDLSTGMETNLAVIPNTVTPVSVTTIRDAAYNTNCPSANAQYFDEYYGTNNPLAPVNMQGLTVPLTAESPVVPGNAYKLKLVIADYMDSVMDSAVFIDAGSFNIGSPEYAELNLSNGNILCDGETTTISINLPSTFAFQWSLNGVIIPDATGNTIVANQEGVYTVAVTLASGCVLEYSSIVQEGFSPDVVTTLPDYIIFEPTSDGVAAFDLAEHSDEIIGDANPADFTITYHLTLADAEAGVNPLLTPYINTNNPQFIFVRVANAQGSCYTISSLKLIVVDENFVAPAPTGAADQDFVAGQTLADLVVEGENIQWYDNPGAGAGRSDDTPLPLSTLLVDGTTYYASQTIYGIESIDRLAVTVHLALSTQDNDFAGLKYYPNPVNDVLTIVNSEEIRNVTIYNLLGQSVYHQKVDAPTTQVNLSWLEQGIYLVKVTVQDKEHSFKMIKE